MKQLFFILAASLVLAGSCFANLVTDPNGNTLPTSSFTLVTASGPTFTGWSFGIVSGAGNSVVEHDPNVNFPNGGALYMSVATGMTIYAIPTLSGALSNSTTYTVSLNNMTFANGTLTLFSGTTNEGVLSGATPSITFTTPASGSTQISFNATGNSDIYNVSIVGAAAVTPEPNSILAAASLAFGLGCVERKRLGAMARRLLARKRLV